MCWESEGSQLSRISKLIVLGGKLVENLVCKMVRAWYMDNEVNDQRLEHHQSPPKFIDLSEVLKTTGVEYFEVPK